MFSVPANLAIINIRDHLQSLSLPPGDSNPDIRPGDKQARYRLSYPKPLDNVGEIGETVKSEKLETETKCLN